MASKKTTKAKAATAKPKVKNARARSAKGTSGAKKVWMVSGLLVAAFVVLGLETYIAARHQAKLKIDMVRIGRIIPQGTDKGQGTAPVNFDGDKQDELYFLQGDNNVKARLQKFSPSGESLGYFEPKAPSQMLTAPTDLATDAQGKVYVIQQDGTIQVMDADLKFIQTIKTGLANASAIGVDSKGLLYVVQDQVNKVTVLSSAGKPMGDFGAPGTKSGDLVSPIHMRISKDDLIAVLERLPSLMRVKVFSASDRKLVRQFDINNLQNSPPLKMGLNGDGLLVFNDATGSMGMLIYDIHTGKFVGSSQTTKDGEKFISPGCSGANRWTSSIYLHTVPGLIKCVMPSGEAE